MNTAATAAATAPILLGSVGTACRVLAEGWRPSDHPRPRIASTVPHTRLAHRVNPGYGVPVFDVRPGTSAAHIRLQPGDGVLSRSGRPITHLRADLPTRIEATRHDGWATIGTAEVRPGRVIFRSTSPFPPYGRSSRRE